MIPHTMRPISTWTDPVTYDRKSSYTFRVGVNETWKLLSYEIEMIGGSDFVVQVDVAEHDLRRDGLPRASARFGSNPGVIISFASDYGPLRYATDVFDGWQANLRAIALALEALRKVDRYGVTKRGEQYAGWKAIETVKPEFDNVFVAGEWMRRYAIDELRLGAAADLATSTNGWARLYRMMARLMHPDNGGSRADWDRLSEARRLIKEAGWL